MIHSMNDVWVIDHPLVQTKVAILRSTSTGTPLFRRTLRELSILMAYEATGDLAVRSSIIETPLGECPGVDLREPVTLVPILRAGLGMAEAILDLFPDANVGHIGMARDETTHLPANYYFKAPSNLSASTVLLLDPMLATGNSAADATDELKRCGARAIRLVALLGCPEGVTLFRARHPDVPIVLAAMDPGLDDNAYIVPGLGDAGDRYFGTE